MTSGLAEVTWPRRPAVTVTPAVSASPAALLHHVRTAGGGEPGPSLVALTPATLRNTVSGRVDQVDRRAHLLAEARPGLAQQPPVGDRPRCCKSRARRSRGCGGTGRSSVDVAVTDLSARAPRATAGHPDPTSPRSRRPPPARPASWGWRALAEAGRPDADVRAAAWTWAPGPALQLRAGTLAHTLTIMPGWHDHPIPATVAGCVASASGGEDMNATMALGGAGGGERGRGGRPRWLRVGTGVGCGVIVEGRGTNRGAHGPAAGLGAPTRPHRRWGRRQRALCRCGHTDRAGGPASVRPPRERTGRRPACTHTRTWWPSPSAAAHGRLAPGARPAGSAAPSAPCRPRWSTSPARTGHRSPALWPRPDCPCCSGIRGPALCRGDAAAARTLDISVSDAPELSGRVGAALMAIEGYLDDESLRQAITS